MPEPPGKHQHLIVLIGRLTVALSATLCVVIAVVYVSRPDACAAVTVFPVWVWTLTGWVLIASARRQVRRRWGFCVAIAWCIVLLAFADHPISLLRFSGMAAPRRLRIVSINCAGSSKALGEVADLCPDIVLVQESPGREAVVAFAHELYGERGNAVWGPDASIVARGRVTRLTVPATARANATYARIGLAADFEVDVVSLRLEPAIVRVDLWSPDCWREQTANRVRRRTQLQTTAGALAASSQNAPLIVGGDFNAPPGDAVFRALMPRFHDAFTDAGRGWGNSIINSAPFLRIDQIWLSALLKATDTYSLATRHSDHRMVVCDVVLRPPP